MKQLLRDTLVLTLASLFIRCAGLLFSSYLSKTVGADGLGLLKLVTSVCSFGVSLAASGIKLSSIRLVVDARAKGQSVGAAMRLCFTYAVLPGFLSAAALFFAAPVCASFIGFPETAVCMRLYAAALPFVAVSCALSGFFTAEHLSGMYAGVQTAEEVLRMLLSVVFLHFFGTQSTLSCVLSIIGAQCLSDILTAAVSFFLYAKRPKCEGSGSPAFRDLLRIALPDSVSSTVRSALVTVREMLLPFTFRQSGAGLSQSLAAYGVIQGMALPVVYFASCISGAFSGLLIPEIAGFVARNDRKRANTQAVKALKLTFVYSVFVSAAVYILAPQIAALLYPGTDAAFYIRLIAPIIPVSYVDTTTDGILKGLGLQLDSMRFNIIEAAVCLCLVLVLVPRYGVWGYLAMVFAGEIFNFGLSIGKLSKCLSSAPCGGEEDNDHRKQLESAEQHIKA